MAYKNFIINKKLKWIISCFFSIVFILFLLLLSTDQQEPEDTKDAIRICKSKKKEYRIMVFLHQLNNSLAVSWR